MTIRHRRDTSNWGVGALYPNSEFFLQSRVTSGLHTIQVGNQLVDILVRNANSKGTLVTFHGNLTKKTSRIPALVGTGIANAADLNLVAVADPSLAMGPVTLAWYLGNRGTGPLVSVLSPLLLHAIESLPGEELILFGGSGGGYAAINFARTFPNSICLAMNPRLKLNAPPLPDMATYLQVCHGTASPTPTRRVLEQFVPQDLAITFPKGLNFDLLLLQNRSDRLFWDNQFSPFINHNAEDPRLYARVGRFGSGHRPAPRELIIEVLHNLADLTRPRELRYESSGFGRASAVLDHWK